MSRQVLIVDDDKDTRAALRELLEDGGFTVVEATNGRKALNFLTADGSTLPGAILLDLRMPEMTGWELASLLRAYRPFANIPIIAMSSLPPYAEILKGVRGYLEKPISGEMLTRMLNRLLEPAAV